MRTRLIYAVFAVLLVLLVWVALTKHFQALDAAESWEAEAVEWREAHDELLLRIATEDNLR